MSISGYLEGGGSRYLQNIGTYLSDYTMSDANKKNKKKTPKVSMKLKFPPANTIPENLKSHIMRYLYVSLECLNWLVADSLWGKTLVIIRS